jgi:hypothetical protein
MFCSSWLFYKKYVSNQGFWKNPIWKIFNFEKFPKSRMKGFSISKNWKYRFCHLINIWVFFSLLFVVHYQKEDLQEFSPWWKEIFTFQNS